MSNKNNKRNQSRLRYYKNNNTQYTVYLGQKDWLIIERIEELAKKRLAKTYVKYAVDKKINSDKNIDITNIVPNTLKGVRGKIVLSYTNIDNEKIEFFNKMTSTMRNQYIKQAIYELMASGDIDDDTLLSMQDSNTYKNLLSTNIHLKLHKNNDKDIEIQNMIKYLENNDIDCNNYIKQAIADKFKRDYKDIKLN